MENFLAYQNDQYGNGVELDEYNGEYSLVSAKQTEGGRVFKKWCFPEYKKKPIDKSVPWKIPLGNSPAEAIETLKYFIGLLEDSGGYSGTEDDEDIPF